MITTPLLKKPLFYNCYGVREKFVRQAKKNPPLLIRTEKHGNMLVDPSWVEKNCEIIEKVFKIPEKPMKLFKVYVVQKEKEEIKKLSEMGVFGVLILFLWF